MTENLTNGSVIDVQGLRREFGAIVALDGISFHMPPGRVCGLLGENGAGKTTLIKHLLGLYKPQAGTVRVFGRDPVKDRVGTLSRIGYLSEDRDIPGWMRLDELLRYTKAFYPGWDNAYAAELQRTFELRPAQKIKTLSRGQLARAALLVALAYRPPLLLLDEPSSGLDAVVRRDILGTILRVIAEEGRTVLFSSHLIDEVEQVADDVVMMHKGAIVLHAPLADVLATHHRATLVFAAARAEAPTFPGVLSASGAGQTWDLLYCGAMDELAAHARTLGAEVKQERKPSLEDIFVARAGVNPGALKDE